MDLDTLLFHYFGAADPDSLDPETLADAKQRLAIDFGVEREPGRRFALWTLMEALGIAPPPAEAFKGCRVAPRRGGLSLAAWRLERD